MSHSQFRRAKTYTETCMDESLRQAYDYWQDQPGSIRRHPSGRFGRQLQKCRLHSTFPTQHAFACWAHSQIHTSCNQALRHIRHASFPEFATEYCLGLLHC